jgi:cytochrome c oxidase subunit 1
MAQLAGNGHTSHTEYRLAGAYLLIALIALFVGWSPGCPGPVACRRQSVPAADASVASYYQGLTLHGVMNALVWTTFLSVASCSLWLPGARHAVGEPRTRLGNLRPYDGRTRPRGDSLLGNAATVMFTFIPLCRPTGPSYVGLTLVVVGTWLVTLNLVVTYRTWRAQHPGERTPLAAFMTW